MANHHQNSIDHAINWPHYLHQDHTFYFTHEQHDEYYSCTDQSFELPCTNKLTQHQNHNNNNSLLLLDEFPYFDSIDEYLSSWEIDQGLPLLSNNNNDGHNNVDAYHVTSGKANSTTTIVGGGRKRSRSALELEEIEKCFEMPIAMAAKELSVGLTVLKRRCRELNIKRWPYRKLKSLKSLIQNVKELGLNEEIEMLEEQKKMMEKLPEMQYTPRTKKLRQACFKATYKKRRSN